MSDQDNLTRLDKIVEALNECSKHVIRLQENVLTHNEAINHILQKLRLGSVKVHWMDNFEDTIEDIDKSMN